MKLSLIGMSGSGKTFWAKKLEAEHGFKRFSCDDEIARKLSPKLEALGYSNIQNMAKWMGQPYNSEYKERSAKYLQLEKEVTADILDKISEIDEDVIVDTTGSVIYLDQQILQKLSQFTRVIFLDTPSAIQEKMYRLYLQDPKPVIWGELFFKDENESNMEALAKRYPELLKFRLEQYRNIAHITLNYSHWHQDNFDTKSFLKSVCQ